MSNYIGIDYGMGRTNRDPENGIRYGVISQNSIAADAFDLDMEPDYGEPHCPECGNEIADATEDNRSFYGQFMDHGCADYACDHCQLTIDSSDCFPEEPIGWTYTRDQNYSIQNCLDSDLMILKSPFYTFAQFCSPCVPGAGNLDSPMPEGIKTYCFGHDWFEEGKAPYPVYRVADDSPVGADKADAS